VVQGEGLEILGFERVDGGNLGKKGRERGRKRRRKDGFGGIRGFLPKNAQSYQKELIVDETGPCGVVQSATRSKKGQRGYLKRGKNDPHR